MSEAVYILSHCPFFCGINFPEILEVTVVQTGFSNFTELLLLLGINVYACVNVKKSGSFISEISFLSVYVNLSFPVKEFCSVLMEPWLLDVESVALASFHLCRPTTEPLHSLAFGLGKIPGCSCCSLFGIHFVQNSQHWLFRLFSFSLIDVKSLQVLWLLAFGSLYLILEFVETPCHIVL